MCVCVFFLSDDDIARLVVNVGVFLSSLRCCYACLVSLFGFFSCFFFLLGDTFCFVFFFFSQKERARATTVSEKHFDKKRERETFVFVFVFVFVVVLSLAIKEKKKDLHLFFARKNHDHALQRVLCFSSTSRAGGDEKEIFSPPFRADGKKINYFERRKSARFEREQRRHTKDARERQKPYIRVLVVGVVVYFVFVFCEDHRERESEKTFYNRAF